MSEIFLNIPCRN